MPRVSEEKGVVSSVPGLEKLGRVVAEMYRAPACLHGYAPEMGHVVNTDVLFYRLDIY